MFKHPQGAPHLLLADGGVGKDNGINKNRFSPKSD